MNADRSGRSHGEKKAASSYTAIDGLQMDRPAKNLYDPLVSVGALRRLKMAITVRIGQDRSSFATLHARPWVLFDKTILRHRVPVRWP